MPSAQCGFPSLEAGGATPSSLLQLFGPTIPVRLGYDPLHRHTATLPPDIPEYVHYALVDTGAGTCCVDAKLAATLGLPVVDQQPMGGVHGQELTNFHIAQMWLPSLEFSMTGLFAGLDLEGGGFAQRAIVGRNLLAHHKMTYDGPTGSVMLAR